MDFLIPILNTLAIAAVLILLMVGLMSAPWQVLLLILMLGILAYQWLIRRHHLQGVLRDINASVEADSLTAQTETTPQSNQLNQTLHYRGSSYTPANAESAEELRSTEEMTGQYRGGLRKFSL